MASKKQRAKQVKAGATATSRHTAPLTTPSNTSRSLQQTIRCHCAACTKGYTTADSDSQSPFLRLPRECRDRIYEELLIAKLSPENQQNFDKVVAADETPCGEFGRENALDYFESDIHIMPGANERYRHRFIVDAMGLLLANKQIHAEVNTVLFSKNTFVIMPEWERVHTFWRCERPDCHPPGAPCFIMFHNFLQIQHVNIFVHNSRGLSDPMLKVESANLEKNIMNVARCLAFAKIKLKTLKIRYTSCFEGQIDAVRDAIEGPLDPKMPVRPIMLMDKHGKYYHFKRQEAQANIFPYCSLLEPLLALEGIAEDVRVRGDMPQTLMDKLTITLTSRDTSLRVKKRLAQERAARAARPKPPDHQKFFAELREKNLAEGNAGAAELADDMTKMSVMSPAVLEELMRPPTKEELERYSASRSAPAAEVEEVDDEDEQDGNGFGGGIGMLNGKPVFGPVRPLA